MVWNEPDLCPNNTNSDCIAPVTATLYFKTISDTILSADPTARMIVGNVGVEYPQYPITGCGSPQIGKIGCGVYWLTQFISAYTTTYGIDPRPAIAGYGIHAYSIGDKTGLGLSPCGDEYSNTSNTNACLLSHFTATVQAGTNWVAANDPGKELWLTEVNWEAADHPFDTWSLQTTRMQQICSELSSDVAAGAVQRYSWFYGSYASLSEPLLITVSLYAVDQSGALSPAGQQFISCGPR